MSGVIGGWILGDTFEMIRSQGIEPAEGPASFPDRSTFPEFENEGN